MTILTIGALKKMLKNEMVVDPILKIWGHVKHPDWDKALISRISHTSIPSDVYWIFMFDDDIPAINIILDTSLNYLIYDDLLTLNTIIRVKNYVVENVTDRNNERKVIIIKELDIVSRSLQRSSTKTSWNNIDQNIDFKFNKEIGSKFEEDIDLKFKHINIE